MFTMETQVQIILCIINILRSIFLINLSKHHFRRKKFRICDFFFLNEDFFWVGVGGGEGACFI